VDQFHHFVSATLERSCFGPALEEKVSVKFLFNKLLTVEDQCTLLV